MADEQEITQAQAARIADEALGVLGDGEGDGDEVDAGSLADYILGDA